MGLARALGSGWDEVNAAHLGAPARRGRRAWRCRAFGPRAMRMFAAFPEAGAGGPGRGRGPARPAPPSTGPDGRRPRPDGPPHRRGAPRRRRLRRVRRQSRGPGRGRRSRRPDRPVRDDARRSSSRACRPTSRSADLGRHALQDVPTPEQLFQLDVPGAAHGLPAAPRRPTATIGNLPDRLTSFVGRDERAGRARATPRRPAGS